ncbi:MAG: class I adenylate-forming enzyme family protein [Pseudomonadota bacterium]
MILSSQQDIQKFSNLGVWGTRTLMDFFKVHLHDSPDSVCIVDPPNKTDLMGSAPQRLTYREFDRAVDAAASALVRMGVQKDDVIVVQMPNCWELAMLYLAISKTGAVISPAPVLWREAELGHIAELTRAKLFITVEAFNNFNHREMAERIRNKSAFMTRVLIYPELLEMIQGPVDPELNAIPVDANDIFSICWTSGTEANSKGCPLSHNNWAGMAMVQDAAGMQPGDTFLTAGPLVNMASLGTVYVPWLVLGGTMVLHHPFDPQGFMMQIMQEKPQYTLLVPAVANMIVKHPMVDHFDLSCFRSITLGSAPPSLWSMQEFKRRWNVDIGNIWGQNEGTGIVAGLEDIPEIERRVDHFPQWGKPGANWKSGASRVVEVKIIDPEGNELTGAGEVGELVYKGPGVIAEYYKNPEATNNGFTKDGYFKTGDLFRIREGYCISFFERGKDIIIRGGYNISSQEVENYLLSHPDVQEAAVVGMLDEKLGERMCAYIVPMKSKTVTLEDLTILLTEKGVAKYKHPERIEIVEAIPRNPVGKILKKVLRADIQRKKTQEV